MWSKLEAGRNVILMLLAVLFLAIGCSKSGDITLDASDDGGQIEVKKGQILVVALEANPTTGYQWEAIDVDEAVLQQTEEPTFEPKSDALGAPSVETIRFKAVGTGQTTLRLVYHRPWEEGVQPEETFSVEVTVR